MAVGDLLDHYGKIVEILNVLKDKHDWIYHISIIKKQFPLNDKTN